MKQHLKPERLPIILRDGPERRMVGCLPAGWPASVFCQTSVQWMGFPSWITIFLRKKTERKKKKKKKKWGHLCGQMTHLTFKILDFSKHTAPLSRANHFQPIYPRPLDSFLPALLNDSADHQPITRRGLDISWILVQLWWQYSPKISLLKLDSRQRHSSGRVERRVTNIQYLLIRRPSSASVFCQHWVTVSSAFLHSSSSSTTAFFCISLLCLLTCTSHSIHLLNPSFLPSPQHPLQPFHLSLLLPSLY